MRIEQILQTRKAAADAADLRMGRATCGEAATTLSHPQPGPMPRIPCADAERAGERGLGAGCWVEVPALSDPLGVPELAIRSGERLLEIVAPAGDAPLSVPRSAGGCPGELQRSEGTRRAGAASGGCSPTAGGTSGASGSICTPEKRGWGARSGEASYLAIHALIPYRLGAATARPGRMSASRTAERQLRRRAQDPDPHPASYGAALLVRDDEVDLESWHSPSVADRIADLL